MFTITYTEFFNMILEMFPGLYCLVDVLFIIFFILGALGTFVIDVICRMDTSIVEIKMSTRLIFRFMLLTSVMYSLTLPCK